MTEPTENQPETTMTGFDTPPDHKSGFITIVGRPNVGKSTLLNALLKQKIAIVSPRPQTTRQRQLGIITRPAYQMIFIDTPGVHPARRPLNVRIVDVALSALGDVDLALVLIDAARPDSPSEELIVQRLVALFRIVAEVANSLPSAFAAFPFLVVIALD